MTRQERILYLCRQSPLAGFGSIACRQLLASLKERYTVDLRIAVLPDDQFDVATDESVTGPDSKR